MDTERKTLALRQIKLAAAADAKTFSGYLAGYGNIDSYADVFEPGAFAQSITDIKSSGDWPPLLLNHGGWEMSADDSLPVGIYADLTEDDYGLKFDAALADTQRGQDIYTLLKMQPRPAISGMSVGYIAQVYHYEQDPTNRNREIRRITQARLVEGSIVTFPANKNAQITDVKRRNDPTDKRRIEQALRDVGLSQREAKALLAGGYDAIVASHRDGGGELDAIAAALKSNIQLLR